METLETANGVFLKDANRVAVFNPATMQLFDVEADADADLKEIRDSIEPQWKTIPTGPTPHGLPEAFHLSRREAILPLLLNRSVWQQAQRKPRLGRLTINISNACNLWCSYCYADHGLYHAPKSFMPPDRASAIVRKIVDYYGHVETVQFFGGEPLMNCAAIDAVAEEFERVLAEGKIARLPNFVATTNGTISTPPVIDVLKRRGLSLTVSWDGPKPVHDAVRPDSNGGSSYDKIVESIGRFEKDGIAYDIECTFNSEHLKKGFSVVDMLDFFGKATGQRLFHISPAFLPDDKFPARPGNVQEVFRKDREVQQRNHLHLEKIIPLYRDAARHTVQNVFAGKGPLLEFANRIVEQILAKQPSVNYCPAFFSQISIATDGTAFPCFMFIGDAKFRLGNILTDEFPTPEGTAVFNRYFAEFGPTAVGTTEWYAPLFAGCVAGEYITSSHMKTRTIAQLYRAMIEECLLGVAICSRDTASLIGEKQTTK